MRQTQRSPEGPRHLHRIPRLSEAPEKLPEVTGTPEQPLGGGSALSRLGAELELRRSGTQLVKNPPATWETWVRPLGWEDPLEKGKASHSSILP